jgi:type II secretion system protein N
VKLQLPKLLGGASSSGKNKRTLLWVVASTGVLFLAIWLSLPKAAIAWRIEREAKRAGYSVSIGSIDFISPFGSVTMSNVSWLPPGSAKVAAVPIIFERLKIGTAPWALYKRQEVDAELEAALPQGTIRATFVRDVKAVQTRGRIENFPLEQIPYLRQAIVAPVEGAATVNFDLVLPEQRLELASGAIDIACRACAVGDGVTPLLIPGSKGMLATGVTMPQVLLGDLDARIVLDNGLATVESFVWRGDGIEIAMGGTYRLRDSLKASRPDLIIKLKIDPELKAKNDALALLVGSGGESTKMEPPEQDWLGFCYIYDERRSKNVFVGINKRASIVGESSPMPTVEAPTVSTRTTPFGSRRAPAAPREKNNDVPDSAGDAASARERAMRESALQRGARASANAIADRPHVPGASAQIPPGTNMAPEDPSDGAVKPEAVAADEVKPEADGAPANGDAGGGTVEAAPEVREEPAAEQPEEKPAEEETPNEAADPGAAPAEPPPADIAEVPAPDGNAGGEEPKQ